jgi:hypothetical protein
MKKTIVNIFGVIPFISVRWIYGNRYWIELFGIPIFRIKIQDQKQISELEALQNLKLLYNSDADILVVELTAGHGEVLVGNVNYLLELGYKVAALVSPENYKSGVFGRCNFPKDKVSFYLSHKEICQSSSFFQLCSSFKYVFFNTFDMGLNWMYKNWNKKYYSLYNKQNLLFILHCTKNTDGFSDDYYKNFFMLYNFKYANGMTSKILAPVFYGDIKIEHLKNEEILFYSPGRFHKDVRDFGLIVKSIRELVNSGVTNFRIIFTGRSWLDSNSLKILLMSSDIAKYIDIRGEVSYEEMYKILEQSDYILTSLNKNNPEHIKLSYNHISGNFGLCVGFCKPMLMGKLWMDFYKLTDKGIAYEDNNLYDAMLRAIKLPSQEYTDLQRKLSEYKKELYDASLNNLRETIGENVRSKV